MKELCARINPLARFGRVGAIALLGASILIGCGKNTETVKGAAPGLQVTATVTQLAKAPAKQRVTLRGEMTEKCPVAGCWFMLRDKTGIVRVDTKAAGFVVSDVPLHAIVTVTGTTVPGSEPSLAATGLRY